MLSIKNLTIKVYSRNDCLSDMPFYIRNFFKKIRNLKFLSKFNLDFRGFFLKRNMEIIEIRNSLRSLNNLTCLTLNLQHCRFDDEKSIDKLSKALRNSPLLRDLSLRIFLYTLKSGDNDPTRCFSKLVKEQTSLKSLTLHIVTHGRDVDGLSKQFGEALKNLKSLDRLKLGFFGMKSIDSKEINGLFDGFSSFSNLLSFSLEFEKCVFGDKGVFSDLIKGLKRMEAFNDLELNFRECGNIDEKNLLEISDSLESLVKIKNKKMSPQVEKPKEKTRDLCCLF